jgi:hypothetical protein
MRPRSLILSSFTSLVALSLLLVPPVEAARSGSVRMEILVDGHPLHELYARGGTYVEALKDREYAIRLTNTEPVRIAVALSVDGRNTIDAERTSARGASKWILDPYQSVVIRGWQTSHSEAHRFVFTSESKSYAAWLGDTSSLGVVEAVAYRERRRPVAYYDPPPPHPRPEPWENLGRELDLDELGSPEPASPRRKPAQEKAPVPEPAAPEALESHSGAGDRAAGREGRSSSRKSRAGDLAPEPRPSEEFAATGFGRGLEHRVTEVTFESESHSSGSVRIRYEYRDALVRLGVLPSDDPLRRREASRGFTDSRFSPIPVP